MLKYNISLKNNLDANNSRPCVFLFYVFCGKDAHGVASHAVIPKK